MDDTLGYVRKATVRGRFCRLAQGSLNEKACFYGIYIFIIRHMATQYISRYKALNVSFYDTQLRTTRTTAQRQQPMLVLTEHFHR